MNEFPILTILTALPLAGGIVLAGLEPARTRLARGLALAFGGLALVLALALWRGFDPTLVGFQFAERHQWILSPEVEYRVGVDGLGLLMVLLTAVVSLMAILASGASGGVKAPAGAEGLPVTAGRRDPTPLYYSLVLFLESGLFGTFTALNFFHWFLFWELSLIPAFLLVRLWGGPERASAATQFFIYTMVGSVALLLAFLAIYLATGTFDLPGLAALARDGRLNSQLASRLGWYGLTGRELATVIFGGAFLGFAVKVPLMPFHTWLPSAYAEAPSGTTMLLTGVMSKMGLYGFLRVLLPIFPEQMYWLRKPLLALAVATILFSAGAAFAQKDLKRIFAYSSINHLGYCLLGIFAVTGYANPAVPRIEQSAAMNGVFLQMFNHGLTAATLFWFVGMLERRSGGARGLEDFGGVRKIAPIFCGLMGIALFSSLGLPGLNGFVGEFLIFKGAFPLAAAAVSVSVLGLLVTAVFLLTILQRVFSGPLNRKWSGLADLSVGERAMVAVPIALMVLLGIYPQLVLGMVNTTAVQLVNQLPF